MEDIFEKQVGDEEKMEETRENVRSRPKVLRKQKLMNTMSWNNMSHLIVLTELNQSFAVLLFRQLYRHDIM